MHDLDGLTNLQLYGQKPTEVVYSVSRAELNKRLIDAAMTEHSVDVRFEQQAVDYDPHTAVLRLNDGSVWDTESAPLIAADGAGSVVRRACLLYTSPSPRDRG